MQSKRAQSAMEYLMTYGWAILLLAVVITVLAMLGLFNYNGFVQKAQPGSCSVFRPLGGGGSNYTKGQQLYLTGQCANLQPQYVASYIGSGNTPVAAAPSVNALATGATVTVWVYLLTAQTNLGVIGPPIGCGPLFYFDTATTFRFSDGCGHGADGTYTFSQKQWYMIAATVASGASPTETFYVNGTSVGSAGAATWSGQTYTQECIGSAAPCYTYIMNGFMSNIQLYSTVLSTNAIKQLYLEGIGGDPVNVNRLAAWWPLNGNANDYSGNNYNGTTGSNALTYTTNWQSGYSVP